MNFLFKLLTWCHRLACSRYNQLLYYLKTRHLYIYIKLHDIRGGWLLLSNMAVRVGHNRRGFPFPSKTNQWSLEILFRFVAHYW